MTVLVYVIGYAGISSAAAIIMAARFFPHKS